MSEDAETPAGETSSPVPATGPVPARDPEAADAKGAGEVADGLIIEVDTSDLPATRIAALEAQVAKTSQEKKDLWERFVRASADLENFRKRSKRDLDDARHDAQNRVLKEMLPVADNLERAVAHAAGTDAAAILEGVRLVLRQFQHAFERTQVTAVEAEGKPFDPNQHEAIGQQESDEPPGTVVSVLQRGYRLGDKLLRPALVVVAKARAVASVPATEAGDGDSIAADDVVAPPEGGAGGAGGEGGAGDASDASDASLASGED